jgi:predicted negative regulator of RcsB-dependent stress response
MATLESDDSNIHDAEPFNWRLVIYPILLALLVVVGGLSYYYYLQQQREQLEASARAAFLEAKTPEDMAKVAEQFPHSDQGALALMNAASASFGKQDYASAIKYYQQLIQIATLDPELRDSAQVGLASAFEANGKPDDAIKAYLEVAREADKSPYAPFAYISAARLYQERGDKDNERKILTEAVGLDPDSQFVKQAQQELKNLTSAEAPPTTGGIPGTSTPPATPAANAIPAAPTANVPPVPPPNNQK